MYSHDWLVLSSEVDFAIFDKKRHVREGFDCGVAELNNYIRNIALQQQSKNLTKVYVCSNKDASYPRPILGYYSISNNAISSTELPPELLKKLPSNYPIPTMKIGRLARDINKTSRGFGSIILADAMYRILMMSESAGIYAIDVDAKNARLIDFYKEVGFIQLSAASSCLIMPIRTLQKSREKHLEALEELA